MSDTKHRNKEAERDYYQLPPTKSLKKIRRQQLPTTHADTSDYVIPIREDEDYLRLASNILR